MQMLKPFYFIVALSTFLLACEEPVEAPKEEASLQDQIVNKTWASKYTFAKNGQESCIGKVERMIFNEDGSHEITLSTGKFIGSYQVRDDKYIHFDNKFIDAETSDETFFHSEWQVTGLWPNTMHICRITFNF
jgi:hypothetical protein